MCKKTLCLTLLLSIFSLISCANKGVKSDKTTTNEATTTVNEKNATSENTIKSFKLNSKSPIKKGTDLEFEYDFKGKVDSATLTYNGETSTLDLKNTKINIASTENTPIGTNTATINAYSGTENFSRKVTFKILPQNLPAEYVAVVKSTLPRRRDSYTQGLEFYNNNLYESSGEYGVSYIEYKEFPSLKTIKKKYLDPKYFAEGLTVLNDKLYLLTWQENKAFRLNTTTLEIEQEFSYPTEGWGLTTDGKTLFMSDGSERIYKVSPETFEIESYVEVITSEGTMSYINEMEWINGEIWANIYGYNVILIINPDNGEVKSIVRMPQLLTQEDITANTDVLNGIAYDKKNDKVYITGKNWPKMFEIEIIKQ